MDQATRQDRRQAAPPLSQADLSAARHAPLSVGAFVVLLAALMSLNALATDIMLPGFPDIAADLGGIEITKIQAIVTAYMFGFGLSQLFMGFAADRYGRRPVLLGGLVVYSLAALLTASASDFTMLLAARFIQGVGSGAPRVIAAAAIRDCYEGRRMARVLSLVLTVFVVVPILAPAIGQVILLASSWRWVLGSLAIYGMALMAVCALRFPETLPLDKRRPIRLPIIREALVLVFGNRQTVGYALSAGVFYGSLFAFIGIAQPVLVDVYGLGLWFPLAFAVTAAAMSVSSFANAALVERFGMRVLSHFATIAYSVTAILMVVLSETGLLSVWAFLALQTVNMLFVGLVFSNFNALAMEPQGKVAGVASSFVGAVTVMVGAGIGYLIAEQFDGTVTPLALGYAGCGLSTLALLMFTEGGRLFVPYGGKPGRRGR